MEAEVVDCAHQDVSGFGQSDGVRDVLVIAGKNNEIRFHGSNAIDAPGELGEGADEVELADRLRLELIKEGQDVDLIKLGIFAGDDGALAGEAVAKGVQRSFLFSFVGARTGGFQGVQAVDFGTRHRIVPACRIRAGAEFCEAREWESVGDSGVVGWGER